MSSPRTPLVATLVADDTDPLHSLSDRLEGRLLTPGQAEYDLARRTVSVRNDQRPMAIVRAVCPDDVAAAVVFAQEHDLLLAVRSGGHSVARQSVVEDALVIDLAAMKRVEIDPATRTARVEPGATSGDLAWPAHAHGLALSTGDTHSVGMGGLTTGGGIGYLVRKHGLTIDNLLSARVVTADGRIVTASPAEHPDLFWAIRGGGGNTGVVVEFTYRLAPVSHVLGGLLVLPATREVVRGYLDHSIAAPDELTTIANLTTAPPEPFVPPDLVGRPVLMVLVAWSGDAEDGERALAPLRGLAEPVADLVSWMPYPSIYDFTAQLAEPHGASIRMMFADDLGDEAIDAMLAACESGTAPVNLVQLRGLGGAFGRVPTDATAFAHRDRRYFVAVIAVWLDAADDPHPYERWTLDLWNRLRPNARGVYVNFLEDEGAGRVREAYPARTYERLAAVKRRYDPDNLFHLNQNVPPAG